MLLEYFNIRIRVILCKNCSCDNYEKCSIVGYMPIGFCCSLCYLYDEHNICLNLSKNRNNLNSTPSLRSKIKLIKASIEGDLLKVVITHKEKKEKTLFIDLKKYLEAA